MPNEMEKVKTVKDIFTAYMQEKGLRKTSERYAILEEIYIHPGHFNVESLFEAMLRKNYRVSLATVYNTLQLLLDCNLIVKHRFENNMSLFEPTYDITPHEHLVCLHCGKVEELTDIHIDEAIESIKNKCGFLVHHHLLYIYGLCKECQKSR